MKMSHMVHHTELCLLAPGNLGLRRQIVPRVNKLKPSSVNYRRLAVGFVKSSLGNTEHLSSGNADWPRMDILPILTTTS